MTSSRQQDGGTQGESAKTTAPSAGGGSVSVAFKTINCSSGTDPVADSATDTLNVTGGTGITVTGDSGTDTVTIASTCLTDIVNDTTPQLGGDLDVNDNEIVSASGHDIVLRPGSGGKTYDIWDGQEIARVTAISPVDNTSSNSAYGGSYVGGSTPAIIHRGIRFNDSTDYYVDLSGYFFWNYDGSSDVDVYLAVLADNAATGTIEMGVTFGKIIFGTTDLDGNIFASSTEDTGQATVSAQGVPEVIKIANITNGHMNSIAGGHAFKLRVRRNTSVTGDVTNDVFLLPEYTRICYS